MINKFYAFLAFPCILLIFSACQKEFSTENVLPGGTTTGTAIFSFSGTPGNCTSPLISGTFQAGSALNVSNGLTAKVTVDSTGTFSIATASVNGISFSASGVFTSTGAQNILFTASGTPLAAGTFNFTLGTGGCTFSITCIPGTPATTNDCKACSYVPLCAGSKFDYYDTTYDIPSITTKNLLSSVDTVIDNKTYQKIVSTVGPGYYNCTNGETTAIGYQLVSNNGNTLEKLKSTVLKANAAVGATWSDTVTNSMGQTIIQKFKIKSKGISKAVGTFNFPDIIVVNLETGMDIPGIGFYVAVVSDYYYAKGVGLVEMTSMDPNSGLSFYHSVIKSYSIP